MLDLFLQRSGGRGSLEQLGLGSGCESFGLKVWGEGLRLLGRKFRVRVSIVGCCFGGFTDSFRLFVISLGSSGVERSGFAVYLEVHAWGHKSPNKGYKYSYPTDNLLITTHEP